MANLVHASVESCSVNPDGDTVVLYFDDAPSADQVREVCDTGLKRLSLGVFTDDESFEFVERSTPVSDLAKLRRYEVFPAG